MPVAPSFQDLFDQGEAELKTRRPDLLVIDGDVTQGMLHASSAMADAVIRFGAQSFRDTFIDGASGDALTALVDDHYNIQRQLATSAQVTVEFSRSTGGAGGTIPAGTVVATNFDADGDEVRFTTDSNIVFGTGVNGPISVVCTAQETGRDTNVAANTVVRLIDQPSFDPSFSVNNPATAAGGNDEESDEALRERARNFFLTLRRGTLAALEFGALQVEEVRVATATENLTTGAVTVQVADQDGNSTVQMVADVAAELENWRCAGTTVTVVGGTQVLVDMTVEITDFRSGFDVASQAPTIIEAIEARINKLGPGSTLFLDTIIASAIGSFPDDIFNVTITAITLTPGGVQPIADVVPSSGQVLRAGTITVN